MKIRQQIPAGIKSVRTHIVNTATAAVVNGLGKPFQIFNPQLHFSHSPVSVMGVYSTLSTIFETLSGLYNQNFLRTASGVLDLKHTLTYIYEGMPATTEEVAYFAGVLSSAFADDPIIAKRLQHVRLPQALAEKLGDAPFLINTPFAQDVVAGIEALTGTQLFTRNAQQLVDEVSQQFLTAAQDGTLDEKGYPKAPKQAFLGIMEKKGGC
jgi:hypothetical protein